MGDRVKLADATLVSGLVDTDNVLIESGGSVRRVSIADLLAAENTDSMATVLVPLADILAASGLGTAYVHLVGGDADTVATIDGASVTIKAGATYDGYVNSVSIATGSNNLREFVSLGNLLLTGGYSTTLERAEQYIGRGWSGVAASVFNMCTNLANVTLAGGSTTNMHSAFVNCTNLTSLDGIASWNVGNVGYFAMAFSYCNNVTSLEPLAGWNTAKAVNMEYTFRDMSNITSVEPLAGWDVGNVTAMIQTFRSCTRLKSLEGLGTWNVRNLVNSISMFYACSNLTDITAINNWEPVNANNTYGMFNGCVNITTDVMFRGNAVTCAANMFGNRSGASKYINLYVYPNTSTWNAVYTAMGNATTNSEWMVNLVELTD